MKSAVVTGSGSGLGSACAQAFVEAGYRVAGIDLVEQPERDGVIAVKADITDRTAVADAFQAVVEKLGAPSVCVNAAGVYPRSTLETSTVELYRHIFDVNVLGTVLINQAFSRWAAKGAVCINIASVDALTPFTDSVLYSASKAAVVNFTSGIASELADSGIRVFGLAPGYIATESVKELNNGDLPISAADPLVIGRTCVRLATDGGLPLVTGQTLPLSVSALDMT